MKIWMKSILAGAAIAIAFYFISKQRDGRSQPKNYTLECSIKVDQDTASNTSFSLSKIIEVLKNRFEAAGFNYEIQKEGENNIHVSLSGMTDTLSPFAIFISNGRVQFREVYTLMESSQIASAVIEEMNKQAKITPQKKVLPAKRDSMSKEVNALLDSIEVYDRNKKENFEETDLIQFSHPYSATSYPAEIGWVRLNDTAAVKKIFISEKVKAFCPQDLAIHFGNVQKSSDKRKEYWIVPMYFIKTYGTTKAVIENEDIADAFADFSADGKAQVALRFNQAGTRKWTNLTGSNVGRPLAILIDGKVISAPNVLSVIEGGSAVISGNYTISECKLLSIALKSKKLPAELSIISTTVKAYKSDLKMDRRLIGALISFVVCAGLAFFIFKTLKAT